MDPWIAAKLLLSSFFLVTQFDQMFAHEQYPKPNTSEIVRQRLTNDVILPCKSSKLAEFKQIQWWYRGEDKGRLIGVLNGNGISSFNSSPNISWIRDGAYHILNNGSLMVKNVRRELVERYECISTFSDGTNLRDAIFLRLDFSNWYALKPFSLFYGSMIVAALCCIGTFVLNIIWIIIRWVVLKWIRRTERLSRVRSMLLAMEKYRQKQMESLHEGYSRRISHIRENYHNQMDILRQSYAESADRFRDYRQAQIDNVQQHFDSYYQQITRLREFGSRRVEQLWESYDKSMCAVRTFTLEQRLKILHQYKVKQRYVNKLLEAIATETNVETISKKEAAIREALGEEPRPIWPPPPKRMMPPIDDEEAIIFGGSNEFLRISRSASYYSLPEFVNDNDPHPTEMEQMEREIGKEGRGGGGGNKRGTSLAIEVQVEVEEIGLQPSTSGTSTDTKTTMVKFLE